MDNFRRITSSEGPNDKYFFHGGERVLNLISNNYLGLATHPEVVGKTAEAINKWGVGTGGARLLGGSQSPHSELEDRLAGLHGTEKTLLYNSGYAANLGSLRSLSKFVSRVLLDKFCHASLIDAVRISETSFTRYRHSDLEHLEELLKKEDNPSSVLVATETLFSMEGDFTDLGKLGELQHRYGFFLYLDEAHSFGGYPAVLEQIKRMDPAKTAVMGTLGKALGGFGAFITGPSEVVDWLINDSRPFIYSTAPPAALAVSALAALDVLDKEPDRPQRLGENILNFYRMHNNSLAGKSHIVPIVIGENDEALAAAEFLREKKYFVSAVRHPTVPKGTARLRLSLRCDFETGELEGLAGVLGEALAGKSQGVEA